MMIGFGVVVYKMFMFFCLKMIGFGVNYRWILRNIVGIESMLHLMVGWVVIFPCIRIVANYQPSLLRPLG